MSGEAEAVQRESAHHFAVRDFMSARSSFFGYGMQALLLWNHLSHAMLLGWVLAMVCFETTNGFLAWRLGRETSDPALRRWRMRYLAVALFGVGSCWGAIVFLPGLRNLPQLYMFNMLFVVVVGIFSVQNLCLYWPGMMAFNIGLIWPAAWVSLQVQTALSPAMLTAVFCLLVMVQIYGRTTRKVFLQGMRARMGTEAMAATLRQKNEDLTEALQIIAKMADLDPLTQCMNRRAAMRNLAEPVRHERFGACFGIILLDVDHFKIVNDTHGHAVGDAVLVAVAERLRQHLRAQDVLARWGGEEFLCLMSDVDATALWAMAERLRGALAATPLLPPPPAELRVTASLGLALCRLGDSLEDTIDSADQAMYQAKRAGRNRVQGLPAWSI
ncbi:MAG: hypothetical protein JWQ88_105 [Rhodoferax sp.]|nr:hypothetical protein [Rhodoferax sp.]